MLMQGILKAEETKTPTLFIMNSTGDKQLSWNPEDEDEVKAARKKFNEMKLKGYTAYRITGKDDEEDDELISEFDPSAASIVMAPKSVAG